MRESVFFSQSGNFGRDFCHINLLSLMAEIDELKKKTARLSLLNELHARLSRAVDLPGLIGVFSVWLMPLVEHDLVAYHNPERMRRYFYSSCHGPDRQSLFELAEKLFQSRSEIYSSGWHEEDFYRRNWHLDAMDSSGLMLILRKQSRIFNVEESSIIKEALNALREPLQRVLDYEDLFLIARRDVLTGLANRRVFEERIGPLMDNSKRHKRPLTLACMDLDRFKQINDNLGHAEGDRVLQRVAETFKAMVRGSDLLVRMGGDEFYLLLPETSLGSARVLADRLCRAVDDLEIYSAPGQKLGVSIGLSEWQADMTLAEWLQNTDELLYEAKERGRSQVCQ